MTLFPRLIYTAFLTILISTSAFADGTAPAWLKQAAAVQPPAYDKKVSGVVLLDSEEVTLNSESKLVTTRNYAVKVLTREGRDLAIASTFYLMDFSKVSEINAWLIRSDGSVKEYEKKDVLDLISDQDDVYNEGRIKIIDASDDADVNAVFGYTVTTENRPLFYQDIHPFQDRLPVILSRYKLNLPVGWKASSMTFNYADIKPQVNGTSYVWEVRNLPYIAAEPLSPSIRNIAPRIAVNYESGNNSADALRTFPDWIAVSRFDSGLNDPQVVIDDTIAAKARELTANAKTELDKIRAIGTFAQNLQYISIDIGVGYGNALKPRPSNVVLNRGYGDCKDKATLMRAMLRVLKIDSYPIGIYSGDPTFIREEWASPSQFNHAILAVKVSDETNAPTIINYPKIGRLLIFDATDPYTPVGDLPDTLQGSLALIEAGDNGGLVRMPITPPEMNLLERNIDVSLMGDGSIKGTIRELANGQESTLFRAQRRLLSAGDYDKMLESWLTRGAVGAKLVKVNSNDNHANASFDLNVEFAAQDYAQLMQNRLLVFKPVIVGRRGGVSLTEPKREHPVMLDSNAMRETVTFSLPTGFVVDEMPDAVSLETPFGKYSTKYEVKENKLIFTRSLTTVRTTVPVDKYSSVKDFYSKIMAAEQSPVVLLKK